MKGKVSFKKDVLDNLGIKDIQYGVGDLKTPGLILMVNPGGSKTYFLYRKIKGHAKRIKIGRYTDLSIEQARKKAAKLNGMIAEGENPYEERMEGLREITFEQLYELYYFQHAVKHTKRPKDNKRALEIHIFPKLGNLKISSISNIKIREVHTQIGNNKGKGVANRVITIVNAVFNFGLKEGYFKGVNPCYGLKKYKSKSRDRFLNREELKSFREAVSYEDTLFHDFFLLSLYTGARKSNMLSMCWTDIDFDLKRWRISESQTKNDDVNIVHLSQPAIQILLERSHANKKLQIPSDYVFPGKGGVSHFNNPKRAFNRIKERMKVKDIRFHDLRRTFGSYMAISGASLTIIGSALNHKSTDSTEIYARLTQDPVKNAIDIATVLMS